MNKIENSAGFFIILICIIGVLSIIVINNPKEIATVKKDCSCFELKQLHRTRVMQFYNNEINAQQYKDSIYMDVETFMILNNINKL